MRYVTAILLVLVCTAAASAASFREVARAVNDDEKLVFAGMDPEQAVVRKQCGAAIRETDDAPFNFHCVYVQTEKDLNLFSLEDGYLMAELQVKFNVIDGVALQREGRWAQVQVFRGNKVAAFYIYGNDWIDTEQTEAVYQSLIERGVPQRRPVKWLGR